MRIGWVLAISCIIISCSKSDGNSVSRQKILGTWVDTQHSADSLFIYADNGRLLLFDNSMAFRSHTNADSIKDAYTWQVKLIETGIIIMPYTFSPVDNPAFAIDYVPSSFTWISEGEIFELAANAFRPYINCSDCTLTYKRVR